MLLFLYIYNNMIDNTTRQDTRTFRVGNSSIGLVDYENQLNNDFQNFYNTYAPEWTDERKNQVVQQHQAFMKNIDDGNITGLNVDGTFDIINPENSGIDLRKGKAGEIHSWYAQQEANFMVQNPKKQQTNTFTNTSLAESFLNNTFGGSENPDYQVWYDLDTVGKDGKRGTSGRVSALSNFLNNFDLSKYTDADSSLGGLDNVKQRISRLRTALSDGVLNNEDYAAGAALGFDIKSLLKDPTTNSDTKEVNDNPTQTSEQKLLNIFQGAETQTADQLVGIIDSWKDRSDFTANIGRAQYGAKDYLNKRLAAKAGDAKTIGAYYRNNFFPKFFSYLNDSKFSPEYLANHIDQPIQTWQGNIALHNYINQNLTLAIRNKLYNHSSLLPDAIDKDLNQVSEGFWTVPGSFNEKTGTEYLFNPDSGEYKRVYIKSSNHQNLLQDYLIGKGFNPYQKQEETQSAKNGAKLQYGGNIAALQNPVQPITDQQKDQLFMQSGVHNPIIKPKPTAESIQQKKDVATQAARDKYYNDTSKGLSDAEWNEIKALGLDIGSIAASIGGTAADATVAGVPVGVVAGVASSGMGLGAAELRRENRANAPGGFKSEDLIPTILDYGAGLLSGVPIVGTGVKTASFAGKLLKIAPTVMKVMGAIGLAKSMPTAYKVLSDWTSGKRTLDQITLNEWRSLDTAFTALTGAGSYHGGKARSNKIFKSAQKQGNITRAKEPVAEHWNYKFKVDGKEKQVKLTSKSELDDLAAKVKSGNKEEIIKTLKAKDTSLTQDADKFDFVLPSSSITGKLRSKITPDSKYGFEHIKASEGGLNYTKLSPEDLKSMREKGDKMYWANAKLYNLGVRLGEHSPHIPEGLRETVKTAIKGKSPEQRFNENVASQNATSQGVTTSQNATPQNVVQQNAATPQSATSQNATVGTTPKVVINPQIKEQIIKDLEFSRGKIKGMSKKSAKDLTEKLINENYIIGKNIEKARNILRHQKITQTNREELYKLLAEAVQKKNNAEAALNAGRTAASNIVSSKNGGRLQKLLALKNGGNIIKAAHGVRFNSNTSWGNNVFNNYRQYILDELNQYNSNKGNEDAYGNWLNSMQHSHSGIYNEAGGNKNTWQDNAYTNNTGSIADYQNQYNQDSLGDKTEGGYNTRGISKAQAADRYNISWDPYKKRTSGDWSTQGYKNDNYYSGITDDRRLLGRQGDWDENSDTYKNWQADLNKTGWEAFLDPTDQYYKLRRLQGQKPTEDVKGNLHAAVPTSNTDLLKKLKGTLSENAAMFADIPRLIANTQFNNKNTAEYLKSVRASLIKPETFERNIYGDYATMNAYNTAGANALQQANRISGATSDASLGAASQMEGMKQNNENMLKGRLADNEMIQKTREAALAQQKENNHNLTDTANYNSDKLNQNARERAGIIAANKTKNHDMFWQQFYPAYILKPLADNAQDKKDMQKYLDYASIQAEIGPETKDQSVYQQGQLLKYQDLLQAASDASAKGDTELAKQKNQEAQQLLLDTQKELDRVQKEYSQNRFATLANREGLYYNYKPVFTPTYVSSNKKGGILKTLRNGDHFDTMVREKNKEADRLWKSIEEVSNRFWRQYGKMRQMK